MFGLFTKFLMDENIQSRCYTSLRLKLGYPIAAIHDDLVKVFGHKAPSRRTLYMWAEQVRKGTFSIEKDAYLGRSISSSTPENVAVVNHIVRRNPRATVRQIAEDTEIPKTTVHRILKDYLKLRLVNLKWVPRVLSEEQKHERVRLAQKLLTSIREDPSFLDRVVTGDETWIHYIESGGRRANQVWLGDDEPIPTRPRTIKTSKKVMYGIFFNNKGQHFQAPVPHGLSANSEWYIKSCLRPAEKTFKPEGGSITTISLLHDNARIHTSQQTMNYLSHSTMEPLEFPPHSPDLAPCDFWLFPKLKNQLADRRSFTRQSLGKVVKSELDSIPSLEYSSCFEQWVRRLELCVRNHGEYIE